MVLQLTRTLLSALPWNTTIRKTYYVLAVRQRKLADNVIDSKTRNKQFTCR